MEAALPTNLPPPMPPSCAKCAGPLPGDLSLTRKCGLCGLHWHDECFSAKLCTRCCRPLTTLAREREVIARRKENKARAWRRFLADAAACWLVSGALVVASATADFARHASLGDVVRGHLFQLVLLGGHACFHMAFCKLRHPRVALGAGLAGMLHAFVVYGMLVERLPTGFLSAHLSKLLAIPMVLYGAYYATAKIWHATPERLGDGPERR